MKLDLNPEPEVLDQTAVNVQWSQLTTGAMDPNIAGAFGLSWNLSTHACEKQGTGLEGKAH